MSQRGVSTLRCESLLLPFGLPKNIVMKLGSERCDMECSLESHPDVTQLDVLSLLLTLQREELQFRFLLFFSCFLLHYF